MPIPVVQLREALTQNLIDVFIEETPKPTFIKSLFKDDLSPTRYVSIEVERNTEKVAVDVMRGADGNFNAWPKSTQKVYDPPYFKENMFVTEFDLYDQVIGSGGNNPAMFARLVNQMASRANELKAKIDRGYEKMAIAVLETGIITPKQGEAINFNRKAGSIVDLGSAGGYWASNNDVFVQLQAAGTWMRKVAKCDDFIFNVIMGDQALADFLNNTKVLARQDIFHYNPDAIIAPTKQNSGAIYHGTVSANSYRFQLWSYPQYYDIAGVSTARLNPKLATVIPANPRFIMAYANLPQLLGADGSVPAPMAYRMERFLNEENKTDKFSIDSAAIPIPVQVDAIYTMKAVA